MESLVIKSTLSILILIAPSLAMAEASVMENTPAEYEKAINELKFAKSIECFFPQGVTTNWQGKSMKLEEDRFSNAFHFDNIDVLNKKQARVIGNAGATDARAFMSPTGITFIEITDIGNFTYTTVFPSYLGTKKINFEPQKDIFLYQKAYIAVFSRHIYAPIIGAMPSQYYGFCRILEQISLGR